MRNTFFKIIFICSFLSVYEATLLDKSAFAAEKDDKHINVVVIDAGHGGKDFGASVGNAREKDIVLDLAMRLGKSIEANYPEIKVIYTRT